MTGFSELHRPGDPLILPNAWDVGTARALARAGFPAIGTTSLGLAASGGLTDGTAATADLTRNLSRQLAGAGLGVYLSYDIEDGFSDDPARVAEYAGGLSADGVNIEDATGGGLVVPDLHARKIAAVKQAAPGIFVNARTDVFWLGSSDLPAAINRAKRYVDAGADGIFLPGSLSLPVIERFVAAVPAPVNVLASPALTVRQLAEAGVARVSTGSLLYRVALSRAVDAAVAVRDSAEPPAALSYAQVQEMNSPHAPER